MITLITGTPGAGKTLYCISKLLRDLVGSVIKSTGENGQPVEVPRRILSNIPGLLLDHEPIGPDAGGGLADWFDWCRPGDVIVYDEVQRTWPPRPNGSKVPDYISALETHRHKGVDFIILTQNPMLLDRNVVALVGRHLHIRRFGGVGAAIVYEWDHCSRQLLFSKALKKSTFRYDKSVFKLYTSSQLHTKPQVSIPPLAYIVGAVVCVAAFIIPDVFGRIAGKAEQVGPAAQQVVSGGVSMPSIPGLNAAALTGAGKGSSQAGQPYDPAAFVPRVSYEPLSAPAYDQIRQVVAMPVIAGGACFKGVCKCYTHQGSDTGLTHKECEKWIKSPPFDPYRAQVVATASAVVPGETGAARTPSAPVQNSPAHASTSEETRYAGGVSNPLVDMRHEQRNQQPGQAQQVQPMDAVPIKPPTLLSPYRRS